MPFRGVNFSHREKARMFPQAVKATIPWRVRVISISAFQNVFCKRMVISRNRTRLQNAIVFVESITLRRNGLQRVTHWHQGKHLDPILSPSNHHSFRNLGAFSSLTLKNPKPATSYPNISYLLITFPNVHTTSAWTWRQEPDVTALLWVYKNERARLSVFTFGEALASRILCVSQFSSDPHF